MIARNNFARVLTAQGRLTEATDQYREVVRLSPDSADAQNNLGNILLSRGLDDEAIAPLNRALELNPSHPEAHFNLARLDARRGNDQDAVAHFRRALSLRPEWPTCLAALAWVFGTHAGRTADERLEAVTLAKHAVTLTARQDSFALDALAAAYAASGRFAEAIQTARAAAERAATQRLDALKSDIEKRLNGYEHGRPYVE